MRTRPAATSTEGGNELSGPLAGPRSDDRRPARTSSSRPTAERPVLLAQVARVVEAAQVKRGDAAGRTAQPAVILTISKQPGADTRRLTDDVIAARSTSCSRRCRPTSASIPTSISRRTFIDLSIDNVIEALRDGGILVVIILFLFLLNFRTTFITLTAIPLSIVVTGAGLQVVRHVDQHDDAGRPGRGHRRAGGRRDRRRGEHLPPPAREPARRASRSRRCGSSTRPAARSATRSSSARSSSCWCSCRCSRWAGMEGRLFAPLGVAYIVSILASLVVSLTVTPVLSYWLLPQGASSWSTSRTACCCGCLKWLAGVRDPLQRAASRGRSWAPWRLAVAVEPVRRHAAGPRLPAAVQRRERAGQRAAAAGHVAGGVEPHRPAMVDERLQQRARASSAFGRRTGRAELDEHAEGVNVSEIIVSFDPESRRSRARRCWTRSATSWPTCRASSSAVEQPLAHLISHMLSGVKAQVGHQALRRRPGRAAARRPTR